MSGIQLTITTSAEQAVAAATKETVLQAVAASNHRVKILSWGIYFDGISPTDAPIQVSLKRQTGAGTSSALTPVKVDASADETLQTTAREAFTAEPTDDATLKTIEVHPQAGYEYVYPFGQEDFVPGGGRVGITVTAPAGVNCHAHMRLEE